MIKTDIGVIVSSILMTFALGGCDGRPPEASLRRVSHAQLTAYAGAINSLAVDCGREKAQLGPFPEVLLKDPGWQGWKGPYIEGVVITNDRWGVPYKFLKSNSVIRLVSAGPDRMIGTTDDIVVIAEMPGIIDGDENLRKVERR